jgi:hypothetical protein
MRAGGGRLGGADGGRRGLAAALLGAPFLRLALAQPDDRSVNISRHLFAPGDHDRLLGMRRGEDLPARATTADGAAIERRLDLIVGEPAAPCDGGGEIGMVAAPVFIGGDVDLEEIGDIGRLGAEGAELAGLGGVGWVVGGGFPVLGGIRGCFYFFGAFLGGFGGFFWFGIRLLWGNSLIRRNREFGGAEQGIWFVGTGNLGWAVAGGAGGERSDRRVAVGQAEGAI